VAIGVFGGIVYDALLIECARAVRADRIYTFNRSRFLQLAPDLDDRIMTP
jgi:predicted nucleic acid-binding protein